MEIAAQIADNIVYLLFDEFVDVVLGEYGFAAYSDGLEIVYLAFSRVAIER